MRELKIPISSFSFATAGVRVAREMGIFEKYHLNANVVLMDSGNAAISALIGGAAEVVLTGPGEIVAARGRGQAVVIVADVYRGLGASLVLSKAAAAKLKVKSDAPVAERLKALDGLLIASASATSAYTVAFKGAAESQGANIRFSYMAQPAMVAALESGAIDGFIAGAPFWGISVTKGNAELWLSGPKGDLPKQNTPVSTLSFQATEDFAAKNPDLMDKLIAVTQDLGTAVRERPEDVKKALAKLYPDVDVKSLDLLFAAESPAWESKPLTKEDMAHEIAFVKSMGISLPQIDSVDPADLLFKKED
ncbi:MAG: ABC transporter substrate-binding protein [Phyllobacterium sp.]